MFWFVSRLFDLGACNCGTCLPFAQLARLAFNLTLNSSAHRRKYFFSLHNNYRDQFIFLF